MRRFGIVIALLLGQAECAAQDIHFSQADASPMLLNPAYCGFFEGKGRFAALYRNQWATVSIPYQTAAATAEAGLWRSPTSNSGLSAALSFFDDRAGTLGYGTTSANLAAAYYFRLGRQGGHILSIGLEGGFGLAGFNPERARLSDPSESFETHRTSYPLFAAGMAWYCQPNSDLHLKVGFSARNLNQPNTSYLGIGDTRLWRRYALFARAEYRAWSSSSILPVLLVQLQGNYREAVLGADWKWYIEEGSQKQISFRTGLAYRFRDAVIANLIVEYNAFLLTFCYDANVSRLTPASRYVGAFEAGLVYRLTFENKMRKIKCPDF